MQLPWKRLFAAIAFVFYLAVLFKIILFKFGSPNIPFLWTMLQQFMEEPFRTDHWRLYNFVPFQQIAPIVRDPSLYGFIQVFGNIGLFVPFGIFIGCMIRGISITAAVLLAFGLSLLLECSQLVFYIGAFDVDDLILNTLGGAIGIVIYKRILQQPDTAANRTVQKQIKGV
ncbi:VanZ family protein [Paenibacillus sp. NEAU-GSW1]|uniref:VanZ family protein n=1 Tax=Paenibacillus sp. NEAU-GSW1 TaxID=2682486 RepID=UPI0012E1B1B9|nr:VanZ family protein [Paenibacillus sp. NEAU-GSW1]MUT68303.1 VanZ family protein [Paenibacillus sp. NEAU-GSW1]